MNLFHPNGGSMAVVRRRYRIKGMNIRKACAWIRSQEFLSSVGVLVGGTGFAAAISAVMLPILTRLYTPQDFSLLAVLTAMISIMSVVACLRFDIAIPIPEHDNEAANILALAMVSVFAVVIVLSGVLFAMPATVLARFRQPNLGYNLWIVPVGVAAVAITSALQYWLVRKKDFHAIARNRIAQASAAAATQLSFGGLNGMALGLVLGPTVGSSAACAGLAYRIARTEKNLFKRVSWRQMQSAFLGYHRFPKYSTLEALSNSAGIQLPIIMIAALAHGPEAGFLSLAMFIIQAPMGLLGTAIGQVFLSRAPQEHRLGQMGIFTTGILGGLLKVGVGPLIFGGLLAPDLFTKVFGEDWRRAGILMAWMTPWFVMQFLASPVSTALHVVNRQRAALLLQLFGVVIRVAAVYGASLFATGAISEAYAVSGFVFYLVYLLVVLNVVGVSASGLLDESRKAAPWLIMWVGAGLLLWMVAPMILIERYEAR
jgi:O-antigen/teichoic acid export membrane protein